MSVEELYRIFLDQDQCIYTDTRKIMHASKGIFFSLFGPNFNGNKYASIALDKGCSYAVVSDKDVVEDERYIVVEDTHRTLESLAAFHRNQLDIPIIAITGSNGKTTTKELLKRVLSTKYKVQATQGNFNNFIGVPLTLCSITHEHEIAIIEVGTNSPGEIAYLSKITNPTHGLITSIGKAHIEKLGSVDGVAREKLTLYRYIQENDGVIFYDVDNGYLSTFVENNSCQSIGFSHTGSIAFQVVKEDHFPLISAEFDKDGKRYALSSTLFGIYNFQNIISALTIGDYFDVDLEEALAAIHRYRPTNNRSQIIVSETSNLRIVLDAYNANPTSMKAAISEFTNQSISTSLILGDMLELGDVEMDEHKELIEFISEFQWSSVILIGSRFLQAFKQLNSDPLINFKAYESTTYFEEAWPNYAAFENITVLIKGSRSMKLETIIDLLE